jgi:nucleoid-associated protein YgaU
MRTEFKVGIVVGLVVIAGAIVFFVNQGRKAGSTAEVLPVNAPAQHAAPGPAKPEAPRDKIADKRPATPSRTTPAERPAAGEQRSVITPPPAHPPSATTQPVGGGLRPGEPAPSPVGGPIAPRTTPTLKPVGEGAPASQPRVTPELPPLVTPGEQTRTTPPGTPAGEPATRPATPAVSPPPRKEAEPPGATPLPAQPRGGLAAPRKYTVAEGESLWSIAEEQYGDGHLWTKILAANPGIDELVKVGQVINLPPKEELLAPAGEAKPGAKPVSPPAEAQPGAKPVGRAHTYVVEKGDTLYSIAAKVLGNGNRWREIFELNKDKFAKPEDLKVGMELKLPAKEGESGKGETSKPAPSKPEPKKSGAARKS